MDIGLRIWLTSSASCMADAISSRFGEEVRRLRMERGLSQEALAETAGLDRTFISMVERGVRRPTLDSAKRITDALEVSLGEVIRSVEQ